MDINSPGMLDTFDGSKPYLVNSKTIQNIESRLNVPERDPDNRVVNGINSFYREYIEPNLFPLIVIGLLAIYLIIKYIIKKDKELKKKEEEEKNNDEEEDDDAAIQKVLNVTYSQTQKKKKKKKKRKNVEKKATDKEKVDEVSLTDTDDFLSTESDNSEISENTDDMRKSIMMNTYKSIPGYVIPGPIQGGMQTDNVFRNQEPSVDINSMTQLIFGNN